MIKILREAGDIVKRRWPKGRGWKVFFIIVLIILSILGIVALTLWLLGKFIKGLTIGGMRNRNLYIPRMRYR